mgnify:CR=1 FL=1
MKKVLVLIMLIITCVSFGKNDNGDNITVEAKGMLRFIWNDHGKYSKSSKFPITGFENNGTAGFAIDIVLLVTIPIMLMIFVFDYTLKGIEDLIKYFERHRGKVRI